MGRRKLSVVSNLGVKITKSMFGYVRLEGVVDDVLKVMKAVRDVWGRDTEDVNDTIRILSNFDVFYESMRRRFKEYIAPRKRESELVKGLVVVEKIKLTKEGGRRAVVVFDKGIELDDIKHLLDELGIEYEVVSGA